MRYGQILLLLAALLFFGCERERTAADGSTGPSQGSGGNLPPETHLFLYPDSAGLDTTASVLEVHWWGQDPDGWVVGYFVKWDYFTETILSDSIWLTSESETFYLPLDSAYDEFSLTVRAVDDGARWDYPGPVKVAAAVGGEGSVTAGILDYVEYEAFLDVGDEPDVYDAGDSVIWEGNIEDVQTAPGTPLSPLDDYNLTLHDLPPTSTDGAMDPEGAALLFRVENTPPEVFFRIESNPTLNPGDTYRTFPTRSFFWDKSDLDGEETIDSCFYALDPDPGDTNWVGLPGTASSVTLTDLEPGYHRFFLKIQDIAGAQSSTISFPDTSAAYWEVVSPVGDLLIIDDYALDQTNIALNLYQSIFDTLPGIEGDYSVWEVGEQLPYALSDVLATLNYFDQVLWYSFYGFSHYTEALSAISGYLESGGAILISASQVDTSGGLIPVAEFTPELLRVGPPNGLTALLSDWPDLTLSEFFSNEVFGLDPAAEGEVMYELDPSVSWSGYRGVCVRRTDEINLIFMDLPLHLLNGSGTLPDFLEKVFVEEFP